MVKGWDINSAGKKPAHLMEHRRRFLQRDPNAPGERRADGEPRQDQHDDCPDLEGRRRLGCTTGLRAEFAAFFHEVFEIGVRSVVCGDDRLDRRLFFRRKIFIGHEIFSSDRSHQQIAYEARDQQPGKHIHGLVIDRASRGAPPAS